MNATKAADESPSSRRPDTALDRRYGKIGISAVAAAVCPKGEQSPPRESRFIPVDSD